MEMVLILTVGVAIVPIYCILALLEDIVSKGLPRGHKIIGYIWFPLAIGAGTVWLQFPTSPWIMMRSPVIAAVIGWEAGKAIKWTFN